VSATATATPPAAPADPPRPAPPGPFDWCIACEERPAAGNGLLCRECDESLPLLAADFMACGTGAIPAPWRDLGRVA
jgi:hypothetical protein